MANKMLLGIQKNPIISACITTQISQFAPKSPQIN